MGGEPRAVDAPEGRWAGLREFVRSAFPKGCGACGRVYRDAEEFGAATHPMASHRADLEWATDDEGRPVLEFYRNCRCGSTLMVVFADRRDPSAAGEARRGTFDALLETLVERGVECQVARGEVLEVLRSDPVARLLAPRLLPLVR